MARYNARQYRNSPYDLEMRYAAAYRYNRSNWDNPNSATSMNSPVWSPDENWGQTDPEVNPGYPPYRRIPADWWNAAGPHAGQGPRNYQASDRDIYRRVSERLAANGALDARNITVHVKDREVTLVGTVNDRAAKRLAQDIADSVRGVADVRNELQIH